jgi:hypothetical protein
MEASPLDQIPDDFPDDLITDQEQAENLGVQSSTLAWWRSQGQGPDFFKIGRKVFYSRRLTTEWMVKQRRSPRQIGA